MDLNLWKNKDELKKYLENLGIEYRYGCFEEKKPDACHLLGDYLLSIEKTKGKAAQVYKANCDERKHGLSCDAYGRMAYKGEGMAAPSVELGLEYFTKGCDADEPRSCYHGGQIYGVVDKKINQVIAPDPDKAFAMLKKACLSQKQPNACTLVHSFYLRGIHGRPADLKQAADWALIACDQNEYMSCYNLSRMYHLGEGVKADAKTSAYYRERAKEISKGATKHLTPNKDATPDL